MPRLTKRVVEAAKVDPEHDQFIWDDQIPGFGLRIRKAGSKKYVFQYRNAHRRARWLTLGEHGPLSAEAARALAMEKYLIVRAGQDPAVEREKARDGVTVAAFADRFLREHSERYKKETSHKTDKVLIRKHIKPRLGAKMLTEIERADIARLHADIGRTQPVNANRVRSLLSKMFNVAEEWGLRPEGTNPTRFVKPFKEKARERFLSSAELERLGVVLAEIERERAVTPSVVPLVKLLALTGARLGEMLSLRWEYVDWERGFLRLPDSKTGAKVIPLSPPVVEILRSIPRREDCPWVLEGRHKGQPLANPTKPWKLICERAGLEGVRMHDLRHTFASFGASRHYGLPVVGALLGHKQESTTRRYAHCYDNPVKQAAEDISGSIAAALGGVKGAEITRLDERRDRGSRGAL